MVIGEAGEDVSVIFTETKEDWVFWNRISYLTIPKERGN
jgi:hypothetical protein